MLKLVSLYACVVSAAQDAIKVQIIKKDPNPKLMSSVKQLALNWMPESLFSTARNGLQNRENL